MKIPLLDLQAQFATIREEVLSAVMHVFESQRFILGENVSRLESLVADYCGCRHAVGVASGTDALLLGLRALGVGHGDAVITSPFTFFATAGAIRNLGAIPVFVDINPRDFNLDPDRLSALLEGKSAIRAHAWSGENGFTRSSFKVVLPVHLYGQMADMVAILKLASREGLAVLEDTAQAIGAAQRMMADSPQCAAAPERRIAGSVGDAGTLSFFPSKNLGAAGDAGMVLTNRDDLAERLKTLRVHGGRQKYLHETVGYNSRLDELQAAVLVAKFRHLPSWSAARAGNAQIYRNAFESKGLEHKCALPWVRPGNEHIFHQYVIRVPERDELRAFLAQKGIGSEVYYPVPLHQQECFRYLGYLPGDLPESEKAAGEVLALPVYPELRPEQIHSIVDAVAEFYANR
jgi:dTDP-4-amino-4,6-dideoxygalactose transaminase